MRVVLRSYLLVSRWVRVVYAAPARSKDKQLPGHRNQ